MCATDSQPRLQAEGEAAGWLPRGLAAARSTESRPLKSGSGYHGVRPVPGGEKWQGLFSITDLGVFGTAAAAAEAYDAAARASRGASAHTPGMKQGQEIGVHLKPPASSHTSYAVFCACCDPLALLD